MKLSSWLSRVPFFTSTPSRIDQQFLGNIGRACIEIRGSKIISVTEIGICEPGACFASPLECRHIVPRPTPRVASEARVQVRQSQTRANRKVMPVVAILGPAALALNLSSTPPPQWNLTDGFLGALKRSCFVIMWSSLVRSKGLVSTRFLPRPLLGISVLPRAKFSLSSNLGN
jgi:hypothetical protein